jgi:GTP cyclohydrolase I
MSELLLDRLQDLQPRELFFDRAQNLHPRLGNSALARPLNPIEHAEMVSAATAKIAELLSVLQVDHRSDHNTRETPKRVARMLVNEVMKGRFVSPPKLTEFANLTSSRELIVMGPIEVRSTCAHHLMPIYGNAYIGVLPSESGEVIGLSKYDRVVDCASRFKRSSLIK